MTESPLKVRLQQLLQSDPALQEQLRDAGLVPRDDTELSSEHVETARVVRTLVQELEVNWAGVEVVLHMRSQLVATRRQLAELAELVRRVQQGKG